LKARSIIHTQGRLLFQLGPRLPSVPAFLKLRIGLLQGGDSARARHRRFTVSDRNSSRLGLGGKQEKAPLRSGAKDDWSAMAGVQPAKADPVPVFYSFDRFILRQGTLLVLGMAMPYDAENVARLRGLLRKALALA
jgi:hypothetical protein